MPKLILSLDGIAVKEVDLSKSRSTIGRRPYNDIVIDNLAVSGEHAVIQNTGNHMLLKDLDSTNGTYVNGKPIHQRVLEYGDRIEIGRYKIEYIDSLGHAAPGAAGKPVNGAAAVNGGSTVLAPLPPPPTLRDDAIEGARVRVLDGASEGKSLALTKVVSTIGKPGVSVASIIRHGGSYDLVHVTGEQVATVNEVPAGNDPTVLKHGDHINVGGVHLEFLDH
jgi:predicted component of type VI protein secretion system